MNCICRNVEILPFFKRKELVLSKCFALANSHIVAFWSVVEMRIVVRGFPNCDSDAGSGRITIKQFFPDIADSDRLPIHIAMWQIEKVAFVVHRLAKTLDSCFALIWFNVRERL